MDRDEARARRERVHQRARRVIVGYAIDAGLSNDEAQSVVGDMLADLLHLADVDERFDFEEALDMARVHHHEEAEEWRRSHLGVVG